MIDWSVNPDRARVAERPAIGNNQDAPSAFVLQSAFPIVVFGAVAVLGRRCRSCSSSAAAALFDHIGDGGLTGESDPYGSARLPAAGDSAASRAEQELEIRQMLQRAQRRAWSAAANRRSTSTPRSPAARAGAVAAGHDPGLTTRGSPARRRAQRTARPPGPGAARRRGRGRSARSPSSIRERDLADVRGRRRRDDIGHAALQVRYKRRDEGRRAASSSTS